MDDGFTRSNRGEMEWVLLLAESSFSSSKAWRESDPGYLLEMMSRM